MKHLAQIKTGALPAELTKLTPEDIANNLRRFIADKAAYSENTFRDLLAVIRRWAFWCNDRAVAYLPIEPELARDYFLEMAESGLASSTIDKHYAMMNMLCRESGLPDLRGSVDLKRAMKRIRREAVLQGERTGQAIPFRLPDLQLLTHLMGRSEKLTDQRNLAFLFVAYNTLCRMSELSRIRVRDLDISDNGHVVINLSHTKTMVTAAGGIKHLSRAAAGHLLHWLDLSGLIHHPDAMVFGPVRHNNTAGVSEKPMSAPATEKIFKDAWDLLGKDPVQDNKGRYTKWSGHSARVGAAMDMAERDATITQIMQEGTWQDPKTVMRYLRRSESQKGKMSGILDGE